MKQLATLITGAGDFLLKLSDGTRKAIVLVLLLLLGTGALYKLVVGLKRLNEPLPAATPEQLIEPMQQLFRQSKNNVSQYRQARRQSRSRLDSLTKQYPTKHSSDRP